MSGAVEATGRELVKDREDVRLELVEDFFFGCIEFADDAGERVAGHVRVEDTDTQPVTVAAEVSVEGLDAVIACVAAADARAYGADWQHQLVVDDQKITGREFIKIRQRTRCHAGVIIKGRRFDEQDLFACARDFGDVSLEFGLCSEGASLFASVRIQKAPADIVARFGVFSAGVALREDDFHDLLL